MENERTVQGKGGEKWGMSKNTRKRWEMTEEYEKKMGKNIPELLVYLKVRKGKFGKRISREINFFKKNW